MNKKNGFTLIELLVVITIISVLMSIGVVSYQQAGQSARNGKRKSNLESVRQALVLYRSDNAKYPDATEGVSSFAQLLTLLQPDYLSLEALADPKNEGAYVYSYTSDGSIFSVCACLEPGGDSGTCELLSQHCVTNP